MAPRWGENDRAAVTSFRFSRRAWRQVYRIHSLARGCCCPVAHCVALAEGAGWSLGLDLERDLWCIHLVQ